MTLARPLLSSVICRLVIGAMLLAIGRGSVPAEWVPYLLLVAGAADVIILWWLIETVREVVSGTAQPSAPSAPADSGRSKPAPDPAKPSALPGPSPAPAAAPGTAVADRFPACVALTLQSEGGNDDDPNDPGGRTSRGIEQSEWDTWRQTHPGLPADVWQAPQDQVLAVYRANYWQAMSCDSLPAGVDYAMFDYGVNSGNGRAAKALQTIVGADVDGEIGPDTIAAAAKADPVTIIKQLCAQRLAFLQGLGTWSNFGRGWTNRVNSVLHDATAMATIPATPPAAAPSPASSVSGAAIIAIVTSLDGEHWTSGGPDPTITSWIEFIATKWPDLATYARSFEHVGYFAWCGLTVGYVMSKAGYKPPSEFFLAANWLQFGTAVDSAQPGDALIYEWGDGSHHVSIYDHETDGDFYASHGGNQSHTVNITQFPMSSCIGIRRPPFA